MARILKFPAPQPPQKQSLKVRVQRQGLQIRIEADLRRESDRLLEETMRGMRQPENG